MAEVGIRAAVRKVGITYLPTFLQGCRLLGKQEVAMSAMPEGLPVPFEVVTETEVDSRGRVSLGRAGAEPGGRYRVARNIDGVLLLTPVVSIPERELIAWENPALAERIRTGIAEAQAGRTVDLGDFTGYATNTDEE
jgi:hypothetical protein